MCFWTTQQLCCVSWRALTTLKPHDMYSVSSTKSWDYFGLVRITSNPSTPSCPGTELAGYRSGRVVLLLWPGQARCRHTTQTGARQPPLPPECSHPGSKRGAHPATPQQGASGARARRGTWGLLGKGKTGLVESGSADGSSPPPTTR